MRGFEVVSKYEGQGINLPKRSTKGSAGYDFESAEDVTIPGTWRVIREVGDFVEHMTDLSASILDSTENTTLAEEVYALEKEFDIAGTLGGNEVEDLPLEIMKKLREIIQASLLEVDIDFGKDLEAIIKKGQPKLVKTGIKAFMQPDEILSMFNRSSGPIKRKLILTNGVGVVDSDYYNNPDNEGEIAFQFVNNGYDDIIIKKGERIGQGVFQKFLIATEEDEVNGVRNGGHGSTGR